MFISPNAIFLQMQKTGCTHITRVLSKYEKGEVTRKHARLNLDPGTRLVFSSIRNPWDWYVSLWAYGVMDRGGLRAALDTDHQTLATKALLSGDLAAFRFHRLKSKTATAKRRRDWSVVYSDSENPDLFRRWLQMALGQPGREDFINGYKESPMARCVGFMTFRFLRLCTDPSAFDKASKTIASRQDVRRFFREAYICDKIVRTEHLEEDLAEVLSALGHQVLPQDLVPEGKSNSSERRDKDYYYDEETRALVAEREWLLIDNFSYSQNGQNTD